MVKVSEIVKHMTQLGLKVESLGCQSERKQIRLETYIEALQQTREMISNMLRKLQEQEDEIIKHMK
jgi:hypothetical protein